MLYKSEDAVEMLKQSENWDKFDNVECWIKVLNNYNLYIFTIVVDEESVLDMIWEKLTDAIALYYQAELDKSVEIWNIYEMFVIKTKVNRDLKYKIEQDKYCARKIILDHVDNEYLHGQGFVDLIENRFFGFKKEDIQKNEEDTKNGQSLLEVLKSENERLYSILTKHKSEKPFTQLLKYLG